MKLQASIAGMSCQHCVKRVEQALKEEFKGSEVVVDLSKNTAWITSAVEIDIDQLAAVIDDAGYELTNVAEIV